ncbi:MAG: trypsin-like peptidase domain-containing protein [Deltaproteobacteria bacterium]|nr:trypsin-like peptidase domain-containing protein [Deltaproteobacteria bacterium]
MAVLVMSLLSLAALWQTAHAGWSISRIVEHGTPSVVRVVVLDKRGHPISSGTGFFMGAKGEVATAYHLFEGAAGARIETADGERAEVIEAAGHDPRRDILVARTTLRKTRPLTLGDSSTAYPGEDVLVLGRSADGRQKVSSGTIAGICTPGDIRIFQMTAPILAGWSGAPVFNTSGQVIGIGVAFLELGQDLSFAIPARYLSEIRPVSLRLDALPQMTSRLQAAMRGGNLIELTLKDQQDCPKDPAHGRISSDESARFPTERTGEMGPGRLVLKNGKKLDYEKAWRDGDKVFIVLQGKKFAVGYPLDQVLWW